MKLRHLLFIAALLLMCINFFVILNEFRLFIFERQLRPIDALAENIGGIVVAQGSRVSQSGNGEHCGFLASRLYRFYNIDKEVMNFAEEIKRMKFNPARDAADNEPAESDVQVVRNYVVVVLEDGPYDAGFDYRCW